jgi:PAS domain S-box-containing protein
MFETTRGIAIGRVDRGLWIAAAAVTRLRLLPYAIAVLCVVVALGLSLALRGIVDPTGLFLVAVAVATWSAGWRAGVVAAGLATITFDYFFTQPLYSVLASPAELPRLAAFTICALAVNWATDARRVAMARVLRESEVQFGALFDDAPAGIAFIDRSGRAFRTNRALQAMFGYRDKEFRRFPFTKVMHPPDAEPDWNLFAELARGKRSSYQFEKHCVTKDGRVLWARVSASLLSGQRGEPLFGIVHLEDITDRKQAELELRRCETFRTQAEELSHTGSWRWQLSSGSVSFSRGALCIMGFDPEQPAPSLAGIRERLHPADAELIDRTIEAALRHSSAYDLSARLVVSADTIRTVRAVGHATVDALGGREYVGVLMDVTGHPG